MFKQVDIGGLIYVADSLGRIHKRRGGGVLKCFPDKDGYDRVSISRPNQSTYNEALHRVIYRAFHGEIPEGMTVDHKDNDRSNNKPDNLQLLTAEENAIKGNARNWVVVHPDGREEEIYNLVGWCKQRGYHTTHLHAIASGKGKAKTYRGMRCYERT